ncbi:MAG: hypothetical protein ACM3MF_01330 [Anaerolineae bacterium]
MNRPYIDFETASIQQIEIPEEPRTIVQAPRLVVVMLDTEEEALLAGRILALAQPRSLPVVLVGIAPTAVEGARVRRKLATIAAFLKRGSAAGHGRGAKQHDTPVGIQVEQGSDWVRGLKTLLQPNDLLACYSDEIVGLRQRPLADILSTKFSVPVYTFTGLHSAQPRPRGRMWSQALPWVSSLASIGGFLVLQARIATSAEGWAQTTLLLVTLFVEAGVIWFVNSIFS